METSEKSPGLGGGKRPPWLNPSKLGLSKIEEGLFPQVDVWLNKLDKQADKSQGSLAAFLLRPVERIDNAAEKMRKLVDLLILELPRDTIDAGLHILSRVVQHRNEIESFKIALPELSTKIAPVPNPFRSDRMRGLSKIPIWRRMLVDDIKQNPVLEGRELANGRVLVSAILFGGLVSKSALEAVYDLLPQWTAHSGMAHGRLAITWTESGGNHRRWLPDALTALLLLRLESAQPEVAIRDQTDKQRRRATGAAVKRVILGYFKSAGQNLSERPADLAELLDAALLHLEVRLPRALTQYAAAKQVSHSLRPNAWLRLMGESPTEEKLDTVDTSEFVAKVVENPNANSIKEPSNSELLNSENESDNREDLEETEEKEDFTWLPDLRKMLNPRPKRDDKRAALKNVQTYLREPNLPVPKIFAGFARDLLQQHANLRTGNTLKTLRTEIIAVATRLPGIVKLKDPASLNPDTLQLAYRQIVEDAMSEGQRRKLAGYLINFHHYLVRARHVEPIDEGETFAWTKGDLTIDANLILEDEYRNALNYLSDGRQANSKRPPADSQLRKLARLILILGYRCGLRRLEVLKLQLTDFNERHPAELLVRPWEQRRLKTPNSTRKLPLYALLTEGELGQLREWKQQREAESADRRKPSPFLFSIPSMEYDFLPEWVVFPLIHEALRAVTGDGTLHFHHLRHSFASWITYALMRPSGGPLPHWLDRWPEMSEWISKSDKLHKDLYGNNFPTRRHLFAVSLLLGHSGPEMSLGHYVHTADQLLALWLEREMPLFERDLWTAASGLPISVLDCKLSTNPVGRVSKGFWALVECRWHEVLGAENGAGKPSIASDCATSTLTFDQETKDHDNALELIDHLWLLLYLSAKEKLATKDLARRFGLSEELVADLVAVAAEVEQQKSSEKAFRHRFETDDDNIPVPTRTLLKSVLYSRRPQKGSRIPCPRKPRENDALDAVKRFAPGLWALLRRRPALCRTVLDHHLKSCRDDQKGLEFRIHHHKKVAKQYLEFLQLMGVRADELQADGLATYVKRGPSTMPMTGDVQILPPASPVDADKTKRNSFVINVALAHADSAEKMSKKASYGMRYLLVMAGIWVEAHSRFAHESASPDHNEFH